MTMPKIVPKSIGTAMIKKGDAFATSLVYDEQRQKTYMAINCITDQQTRHYPVGDGDLRYTHAGREAEQAAGL